MDVLSAPTAPVFAAALVAVIVIAAWLLTKRGALADLPVARGPWLPVLGHAFGVMLRKGDLAVLLGKEWAQSGGLCRIDLQGRYASRGWTGSVHGITNGFDRDVRIVI